MYEFVRGPAKTGQKRNPSILVSPAPVFFFFFFFFFFFTDSLLSELQNNGFGETKERLALACTVSRVNRVSRSFAELEMKARVKIRETGSRGTERNNRNLISISS